MVKKKEYRCIFKGPSPDLDNSEIIYVSTRRTTTNPKTAMNHVGVRCQYATPIANVPLNPLQIGANLMIW